MNRIVFVAALAVSLSVVVKAHAHDEHQHHDSGQPSSKEETAFGRAGDPAGVARTILVEMRDSYQFSPNQIDVRTGEVIRFVVVNAGQQMHEMVIGTLKELEQHNELMRKNPGGMHHDDAHMAHVAPGRSGVITWEFTTPGEFFFACLVDDHFEMGMTGKIRVSGPAVAVGADRYGDRRAPPSIAPATCSRTFPVWLPEKSSGSTRANSLRRSQGARVLPDQSRAP